MPQAILIHPKWHKSIENGTQTLTIREGIRDYRKGFVLLCCDKVSWCVSREIIKITHLELKEVTLDCVQQEGYDSIESFIKEMKGYYPKITESSWVTIVYWK